MNRGIIFVIGSLEYGGAERHLVTIAPLLRERGWEPHVWCLASAGAQAPLLEAQGIDVTVARWPLGTRRSPLAQFARAGGGVLDMALAFRRIAPAIAHFFLPASYLLGAPAALLARVPVKVMSRRSLNDYQHGQWFGPRMERKLHGRMDAVLGNSRAVVAQLLAEGVAPDRVGLIYNGVQVPTTAEAMNESSSRPSDHNEADVGDTFVIACVANLIAYKGHEDLLRALAQVSARLPDRWRCICAGRDDGIGPSLIALRDELGLGTHVKFVGAITDVSTMLAQADLSILASHQEGFSNAVLEAMAHALPLVVTDVGGNGEAVIDEETGFVVPPRNPKALAGAIETLAANKELRQRMGAAAKRRVTEHFSHEACVGAYDALYRGLIEGRSPVHSLRQK